MRLPVATVVVMVAVAVAVMVVVTVAVVATATVAAAADPLLSEFVRSPPAYVDLPAGSEQTLPFLLPAQSTATTTTDLPEQLYDMAMRSLEALRAELVSRSLVSPAACFSAELWPATDDYGRHTWALARWRPASSSPLSANPFRFVPFDVAVPDVRQPVAWPVWPRVLDPTVPADRHAIFVHPTHPEPWFWYSKALFGDCLWVDAASLAPAQGWLPLSAMPDVAADRATLSRLCVHMPQPCRASTADGSARTFVANVCPGDPHGVEVEWEGGGVNWVPEAEPAELVTPVPAIAWPADAKQRMLDYLRMLTGVIAVVLPNSLNVTFTHCEADQQDN
jgi:hypothetical protein